MILFIAVCDTGRLEQMVGTFVRNFCSTTPTSGTGPLGGTLGVGGHISADFQNNKDGGTTEVGMMPPERGVNE